MVSGRKDPNKNHKPQSDVYFLFWNDAKDAAPPGN